MTDEAKNPIMRLGKIEPYNDSTMEVEFEILDATQVYISFCELLSPLPSCLTALPLPADLRSARSSRFSISENWNYET